MRKTIIIAGGFNLPFRNASAVRAVGMAQLFKSLGYDVLILGKFEVLPDTDVSECQIIEGINCRDIRQPFMGKQFSSYVRSADSISAVIDYYGAENVLMVVAYNYPAIAICSLIKVCRRNAVAPVLDCTEWYGWEGRKILRNLWRQAGVIFRLNLLTHLAGNVICASSFLQKKLSKQNTLLLPFAIDTSHIKWLRILPPKATPGQIRFVYSGSPGVAFHKDALPNMLTAFNSLARVGFKFECVIAGLTEQEYVSAIPQHHSLVKQLAGNLIFLGRVSHQNSLELLRSADFMVFFRESNRVSNTGFPTKYVEAATLGVPVITNPTSDLFMYLQDGENGILAASFSQESITEALSRALKMTPEDLAVMRANCFAKNPFELNNWQIAAASFINRLRY